MTAGGAVSISQKVGATGNEVITEFVSQFLLSSCKIRKSFSNLLFLFILCGCSTKEVLYPVSFIHLTMSLRRPPLPRLLLNNVSCMRNAQQILRNVNVSLHDGGALVLTGTNGSGKSTFLRMLAGFSKPSAGEILWNGHDITDSGVFQQYKLQLNWLSLKDAIKEKFTVLDNVQWFEVLEGKQGRSLPALQLMGLGRLVNDKARMLSMGQRKRVQLARLLAIDRPIWLLDEPSVALDDEGVKLLEYIIAEHRKKGGIVIVATHLPIQIEDAMFLRLPPRFPRRMTLVDMLDRGGLD
ncbi:PREDICTED: ABC transporter I family member 1 isoform X1 [Nicotiana attenuata]|nr:PREDICTED: ABC transporter I family member 1 isoform X1 [Nicotiana attenuata]